MTENMTLVAILGTMGLVILAGIVLKYFDDKSIKEAIEKQKKLREDFIERVKDGTVKETIWFPEEDLKGDTIEVKGTDAIQTINFSIIKTSHFNGSPSYRVHRLEWIGLTEDGENSLLQFKATSYEYDKEEDAIDSIERAVDWMAKKDYSESRVVLRMY